MKDKSKLVKDKTYTISYVGYYDYDSYKGEGVYTGEIDNIDGEVFGFILPTSIDKNPCYFPLDSIFLTD